MGDTSRNISGSPTVGFYNYSGTLSGLSYTIGHPLSASYSGGELNIQCLSPWSLIKFLKFSGIVFKEAFQKRSKEDDIILGWNVSNPDGGITRSEDTKFGRVYFNLGAGDSGYIKKIVKLPKMVEENKMRLWIYIHQDPTSAVLDKLSSYVYIDRIVSANKRFLGSQVAGVGLAELDDDPWINSLSDTNISIKIGQNETVGAIINTYITGVVVFTLPSDINATLDRVPFISHYSADESMDDTSKHGLVITIPFEDESGSMDYVFRGCSYSGDESWSIGEDVVTNIKFTYDSLSVGE